MTYDEHNIAVNRAIEKIRNEDLIECEFMSLSTIHWWRKYFGIFDTNMVQFDHW